MKCLEIMGKETLSDLWKCLIQTMMFLESQQSKLDTYVLIKIL